MLHQAEEEGQVGRIDALFVKRQDEAATLGLERRPAVATGGARASMGSDAAAAIEWRDTEMFWQLVALSVLNVCDLVLTTQAMGVSHVLEANQVMGFFLRHGLLATLGFKLGIVTAGVAALWLLRSHSAALTAARVLTAFYAVIVLYQLLWWISLV